MYVKFLDSVINFPTFNYGKINDTKLYLRRTIVSSILEIRCIVNIHILL